MTWIEIFTVFAVCHLVGDFLLQTTWQARNKHGGLGPDPVKRRALVSHVTAYTFAFLPALLWVGGETDPGWAVAVGLLVGIPHLVLDDGRILNAYSARIKHVDPGADTRVAFLVDQSFHVLSLFLLALIAVQ